MRAFAFALLAFATPSAGAQGGPQPLGPYTEVRSVYSGVPYGVRIVYDEGSDALYLLTTLGEVYRGTRPFGESPLELLYTPADHGLSYPTFGMDVGPDGALYLVGNRFEDEGAIGIGLVVRGQLGADGERTWETVARTEPYPRSNAGYDHNFTALAVSPDGADLFVSSGSRTDHGEVQDGGGAYPGLREIPITSALLRVPADATDLVLQNDEAFLADNGYLYADGFRNAFSLAFDGDGRLVGIDNAGDRDDPDELNVIVEGGHYGFPWQIGGNATPQQFPGYDPSADLLLNPAAGAVQAGFFYDDPSYPAPPAGVTFLEPVANVGPDADRYRDPVTGEVRSASADGGVLHTFTAHRSPLGLAFDTEGASEGRPGWGFVLNWTGQDSPLLSAMSPYGEDLLAFRLEETEAGYRAEVFREVEGFASPIGSAVVDGKVYVLEIGESAGVWEVTFTGGLAAEGGPDGSGLHVAAFPNPAVDEARVEVRTDGPQPVEVALYSVLGQRVARLQGYSAGGAVPAAFDLPVAGLAPGAYVLRVVSGADVAVRRLSVVGR